MLERGTMKVLILFLTLRILGNALKSREYSIHALAKYIVFSIMLYGIISRDLSIVLETSFMLVGNSINK